MNQYPNYLYNLPPTVEELGSDPNFGLSSQTLAAKRQVEGICFNGMLIYFAFNLLHETAPNVVSPVIIETADRERLILNRRLIQVEHGFLFLAVILGYASGVSGCIAIAFGIMCIEIIRIIAFLNIGLLAKHFPIFHGILICVCHASVAGSAGWSPGGSNNDSEDVNDPIDVCPCITNATSADLAGVMSNKDSVYTKPVTSTSRLSPDADSRQGRSSSDVSMSQLEIRHRSRYLRASIERAQSELVLLPDISKQTKRRRKIHPSYSTCVCIRNGLLCTIPSFDVYVGDVLLLQSGDEVPADVFVLEGNDIRVDMSRITDDPRPWKRNASSSPSSLLIPNIETASPFTCPHLILASSVIRKGGCKVIAVATGDASFWGSYLIEKRKRNELACRIKDRPYDEMEWFFGIRRKISPDVETYYRITAIIVLLSLVIVLPLGLSSLSAILFAIYFISSFLLSPESHEILLKSVISKEEKLLDEGHFHIRSGAWKIRNPAESRLRLAYAANSSWCNIQSLPTYFAFDPFRPHRQRGCSFFRLHDIDTLLINREDILLDLGQYDKRWNKSEMRNMPNNQQRVSQGQSGNRYFHSDVDSVFLFDKLISLESGDLRNMYASEQYPMLVHLLYACALTSMSIKEVIRYRKAGTVLSADFGTDEDNQADISNRDIENKYQRPSVVRFNMSEEDLYGNAPGRLIAVTSFQRQPSIMSDHKDNESNSRGELAIVDVGAPPSLSDDALDACLSDICSYVSPPQPPPSPNEPNNDFDTNVSNSIRRDNIRIWKLPKSSNLRLEYCVHASLFSDPCQRGGNLIAWVRGDPEDIICKCGYEMTSDGSIVPLLTVERCMELIETANCGPTIRVVSLAMCDLTEAGICKNFSTADASPTEPVMLNPRKIFGLFGASSRQVDALVNCPLVFIGHVFIREQIQEGVCLAINRAVTPVTSGGLGLRVIITTSNGYGRVDRHVTQELAIMPSNRQNNSNVSYTSNSSLQSPSLRVLDFSDDGSSPVHWADVRIAPIVVCCGLNRSAKLIRQLNVCEGRVMCVLGRNRNSNFNSNKADMLLCHKFSILSTCIDSGIDDLEEVDADCDVLGYSAGDSLNQILEAILASRRFSVKHFNPS